VPDSRRRQLYIFPLQGRVGSGVRMQPQLLHFFSGAGRNKSADYRRNDNG
jgi:hypothetical protein